MTEQQTPDREKKIAEIREALEKATPGPWNVEGKEIWKRAGWYFGDNPHVYICDADNPANAHLIANAPEWIGFLLSELDREREEGRKLRQERDDLSFREREVHSAFKYWFGAWQEVEKENGQLQDQLQSARQKIERLREELERIKCSNCGNEGIYETGIEKDGLRETKFCGQCVNGERAKMMYELRSALFESKEESRKLRQEREKLIKALKFYANEDNWRSSMFVLGRAEADGGERAQTILEEIGVTVGN